MNEESQPGNMWCRVGKKAFSGTWAHMTGLPRALSDVTQTGGGILNFHHMCTHPLYVAAPRGPTAPYLGGSHGSGWFDTFKSIGNTIVNAVSGAHKSGLLHKVVDTVGSAINRKQPIAVAAPQPNRNSPAPTDGPTLASKVPRIVRGGAQF